MEQTAHLIFPTTKEGLLLPEDWEMKQTKDGINYLIKEDATSKK